MLDARKTAARPDAAKPFRADDPLRALGIRTDAPGVLDNSRREELAFRLMEGEAPADTVAYLVRTGTPLALAQQEVAQAAEHPYVRAALRLRQRVQKRDWVLQCRARAEQMAPTVVPRLHAPDAALFFAAYYRALQPVVLTGVADHWPAMRWTLDALRQRHGDAMVEVQDGRTNDPEFELRKQAHRRQIRFSDLIGRLADDVPGNDVYLTAYNSGHNRSALASLWDDLGDMPDILAGTPRDHGFLWIGPRGTITPWHHDLTQNLLMTMMGTKRVRMVAPHDTPRMANDRHCFSAFGCDPAPEGGPPVLEVDIHPGDALFLPVGWWHHVEGLTPTVGMSFTNFRWPNDFASFYQTDSWV